MEILMISAFLSVKVIHSFFYGYYTECILYNDTLKGFNDFKNKQQMCIK